MSGAPSNNSASLHAQAISHFSAGRMAEGAVLLEQALELNPGSGEMHSHMGIARFELGDAKSAAQHFEKSVRLEPKNFMVQNECGVFLLKTNRPKDAERHFRKALDNNPGYAEAMLNLGRSLQRQGRIPEAIPHFTDALRLRPNWPDALYAIGMLYLRMDLPEREAEGRQYLERAVTLDPKHENAWTGLIRSYNWAGDFAGEEEALRRAEKHLPHSTELAVMKMTALLRAEKTADIPRMLEQVSGTLKKKPASANPAIFHELAGIYDRMDDAASAFRWFSLSSEAQKRIYAEQGVSPDIYPQMIDGYRKSLSSVKRWKSAPPLPGDIPNPVFLVGFPRSGTTLLDQMFSGHPDMEVAEEKPAIREAGAEISRHDKKPVWEILDKIDDTGIEAGRAAYTGAMKKFGFALRPGSTFIDRMPLNLVCTPLIKRLFPDARFILALRHPCDCVLSNYMQQFEPNAATVHMLDLATAAAFYDRVFSTWEEAVAVLGLQVHAMKYEYIVADMKAEMIKALDFLGLEWHDRMADFDQTAKTRRIKTPSRSQVSRKLYTTARGRWHKYREFMGDVPETLRPWAEKFGYRIDE